MALLTRLQRLADRRYPMRGPGGGPGTPPSVTANSSSGGSTTAASSDPNAEPGTIDFDFSDPNSIYNAMMGVPTPAPRDLGGELETLTEYLPQINQINTDARVEGQRRLYEQQLDLFLDRLPSVQSSLLEGELDANEQLTRQNVDLYRESMLGDQGVLDTFGEARARESQLGIDRLTEYGTPMVGAIEGIYDSVPQTEIVQTLRDQAMTGLEAGMDLTPEEQRFVQQQSREAYAARGMERSDASVGNELLSLYGMGRDVQDQRRQFALGVDQYADSRAASRANAIADTLLGRQPASAPQTTQLFGTAGSPAQAGQVSAMYPSGQSMTGQALNYGSGLFGQNYEGAFSQYNNQTNLLGSLYGGQIQLDAAEAQASAARSAGGMGLFGDMLGAGATIGAAIISDARTKTAVRRLGTTPGGLPWYAFEYIDEPGVAHEGVMAQEARILFPDAVVAAEDGLLAVDYSRIA